MKETTACSRELGFELRRRRAEAGVTSADLADRLGWSNSKLSRLETGWRGAAETDVVQYLSVLGYAACDMRALRALCRESARDLGYWVGGPESLAFHESQAKSCLIYCPETIPAAFRVGDQTPLRPNPRRVIVLQERMLAGLGLEQVVRLVLLTDLPFMAVHVVRGGTFGGAFRLLEFAQHRPLAYVEAEYVGLFLEEHESVAAYRALAGQLVEAALPARDSHELMVNIAARAQADAS